MSKRSWKRTPAGAILAASVLALAGPLVPGASAASTCQPATNVEALVDDSLSMETSDPDRLRVQGLALLIETLPAPIRLGAIEFGSDLGGLRSAADQIFAPAPIGPNAAAMKGALNALVKDDHGLTDYNGAFALADSENPNAQARLLLTDGGMTEGEYANGHLAHNVPTYVTGFSPGLSREDRARLERIAAETGGRYYPLADNSQLQAAINSIGAELTCQTPPRTFTDQLAQGRAASHAIAIEAGTRAVQIALTWASPRDRFKLTGLRLVLPGGATNRARLRVERDASSTFSVVDVSGLRRGFLRFSVEAARRGSGESQVTLTTQVSQEKGK